MKFEAVSVVIIENVSPVPTLKRMKSFCLDLLNWLGYCLSVSLLIRCIWSVSLWWHSRAWRHVVTVLCLWMLLSLCLSSAWLLVKPRRRQNIFFLGCFCINSVFVHTRFNFLFQGERRPTNQMPLLFSMSLCFLLSLFAQSRCCCLCRGSRSLVSSVYWTLRDPHETNSSFIHSVTISFNFRSLIWLITAVSPCYFNKESSSLQKWASIFLLSSSVWVTLFSVTFIVFLSLVILILTLSNLLGLNQCVSLL